MVVILDDIYKDFTSYKVRVPVTGAIILDESFERCLLVKGWKIGASWSFPRGKKNKDEEDHTCAVREVLEETGFDISKLLKIDEYIEVTIGEQRVRLYIIAGVKDDTVFAPRTKKEISICLSPLSLPEALKIDKLVQYFFPFSPAPGDFMAQD